MNTGRPVVKLAHWPGYVGPEEDVVEIDGSEPWFSTETQLDSPDTSRKTSPTMLYERTPDNSARFLLGTVGTNPLVCVGVNPSTATPDRLDTTVARVARYAKLNHHDSWAMLNIYPQRSTNPQGMHVNHLRELKAANEHHIAEFIDGRRLTLLAAWGGLIDTRPYLRGMLKSIVEITAASACDWQSIGDLLKSGHPRHPSRGAYVGLRPFDVQAYLHSL